MIICVYVQMNQQAYFLNGWFKFDFLILKNYLLFSQKFSYVLFRMASCLCRKQKHTSKYYKHDIKICIRIEYRDTVVNNINLKKNEF